LRKNEQEGDSQLGVESEKRILLHKIQKKRIRKARASQINHKEQGILKEVRPARYLFSALSTDKSAGVTRHQGKGGSRTIQKEVASLLRDGSGTNNHDML